MNKKYKTTLSIILSLQITSILFAQSPLDISIISNNVIKVKNKPLEYYHQKNDVTENKIEQSKEISIEGIIKVNTSLRLREYPWGPVIGCYTNNTKCTIIGEEDDFYKVTINGKTGYLHKNYVSTSSKPASCIEPDYPGDCRNGGYIAKNNPSSTSTKTASSTSTNSNKATQSSSTKNSTLTKIKNTLTSIPTKITNSLSNSKILQVKSSVIGQKQGDGTAAGAITWAKDQMAGGTRMGYNKNTGKISKSPTCWNNYCAAFIATAWGRKIPQMVASCAYGQYKNFKRDGMIHTDKNPPAGAIMFTAPTAKSQYGHVFMATGEVDSNGEPIVITSGWNGHNGITTMSLSKMIGSKQYLGWALPE